MAERSAGSRRCLSPSTDTSFSPPNFNDFELGLVAQNQIRMDEEPDKENSATSHPTSPVSERPNRPHVLMASRPFRTRFENVPDFVYRSLFEFFRLSMCFFNITHDYCVLVYHKTFQKLVKQVWYKNSPILLVINFTQRSKFLHRSSPYRE